MGAEVALQTEKRNTSPEVSRIHEPLPLFIYRYPVIDKIRFDPMRVSTSVDLDIAPLLSELRRPVFEGKVSGQIEKQFVPIELSHFRDIGWTEVTGSLKVEPHSHPGTMFALLTGGSLAINGVRLAAKDWYVVPPGVPYGIESADGYSYVFAYSTSC